MIAKTVLTVTGPHNGQPVFYEGEPLKTAQAAAILMHGRGASAQDILSLAESFATPGLAFVAPQAAGSVWYPYPFNVPVAQNEPWLSSALQVIAASFAMIADAGIPVKKILLLGFSQGASLSLEYAARSGQPFGGLVGLSGGVIGAKGDPRQDQGNLAGMPVFLGCSDVDPYIPLERVEFSARLFESLGAQVTKRIYPGMPHTVNEDELGLVREWVRTLLTVKE